MVLHKNMYTGPKHESVVRNRPGEVMCELTCRYIETS